MNHKIRSLLIEQARKGKPIAYNEVMEKVDLYHGNPGDRDKNGAMLCEISKYENEQERPLLSAVAMYADLSDHGYGFYDLAEEFGFGTKKKLAG